jgi:TonB family protein
VKKVDAKYPPEARAQHIQGAVVLNVVIDREGNVGDVQLNSGHPMLAPAAIEAVKQWKYKPYLLNGQPIAMETQVSVDFTLEPGQETANEPQPPSVIGSIPATPGGRVMVGVITSVTKRNADGSQRVHLPSWISQTLLVKRVPPKYPEAARKQAIQAGSVVFKGIISKEGDVVEVQLVSAAAPVFEQPAIDAVRQWKYKPYLLNGRPVEVETEIDVVFTFPTN